MFDSLTKQPFEFWKSFLTKFHKIITIKSFQPHHPTFLLDVQCSIYFWGQKSTNLLRTTGRCTEGEKVYTCGKLTGFHQNLSLFDVTVSFYRTNNDRLICSIDLEESKLTKSTTKVTSNRQPDFFLSKITKHTRKYLFKLKYYFLDQVFTNSTAYIKVLLLRSHLIG